MDYKILRKLHAMLGSDNVHEAETARTKIKELLAEHGKTWNDLSEILSEAPFEESCRDDPGPVPPALDLVHHILKRYLHLPSESEYLAIALWILHTHVFDRFIITPRLVFESPVRGCGKTTALSIMKRLCAEPEKADHITAAALFRLIDLKRATMLLDEVDNLSVGNNQTLLAVFNSGHRSDGKVTRRGSGRTIEKYSTFAPLTLALIGKLPLPLLSRSVVVRMERNPAVELPRFDELDTDTLRDCLTVTGEVLKWAERAKLNTDPEIPDGLRNRAADNWRCLLAIADSFGLEWGARARKAALIMSRTHQDEDIGVILLTDIRDVFNRRRVDRLASAVLVEDLCEGQWGEWRGPKDDQTPRRLKQGELARLLAPFNIRPRTIKRRPGDSGAKGYLRNQFESAWMAYCAVTPSQPSNVRHLRTA